VAGLLAAYTVIQARKTIRQADEERRLSVEPNWDVTVRSAYAPSQDPSLSRVEILLVNIGLGSARNPMVKFTAHNDHEPAPGGVKCYGQLARELVPPRFHLLVYLDWYRDKPLDGTLTVSCTTRLGGKRSARFNLRTSRRAGELDDCEVYRLPDVTERHGRWRWPWHRKPN